MPKYYIQKTGGDYIGWYWKAECEGMSPNIEDAYAYTPAELRSLFGDWEKGVSHLGFVLVGFQTELFPEFSGCRVPEDEEI